MLGRRLLISLSKNWDEKGFVSMFATWSIEGIWLTTNFFCNTFSRTKYKSSSMCLVLEWIIGLADKVTMLRLSQHIVGVLCLIFNFVRRHQIHINSKAIFSKLLYLTLMVDLEIVCCFLEHQYIMLLPRKIHKLVVDLQSSISFP